MQGATDSSKAVDYNILMKINTLGRAVDAETHARHAFKSLLTVSKIANDESDMNTLVLLSGGSALGLLKNPVRELFGDYLTITVLDERYSKDPKVNNFAQIAKTDFYKEAESAGCKFIDTRVHADEDLDRLTKRFESSLRSWRRSNPKGLMFATMGMGADGHTAGIVSYPDDKDNFDLLFNNGDRWVVGYDAEDKSEHQFRVTATLPFLRMIDKAIVFAAGEEKGQAFSRLRDSEGSLHVTPARIVREMKRVQVFTDVRL